MFVLVTLIRNRKTLGQDTFLAFIDFKKAFDTVNPILRGEGHICPPTIQIEFSADSQDGGGSNYTKNLRFVIKEHIKLVSGPNYFSTARESPPKSGG